MCFAITLEAILHFRFPIVFENYDLNENIHFKFDYSRSLSRHGP